MHVLNWDIELTWNYASIHQNHDRHYHVVVNSTSCILADTKSPKTAFLASSLGLLTPVFVTSTMLHQRARVQGFKATFCLYVCMLTCFHHFYGEFHELFSYYSPPLLLLLLLLSLSSTRRTNSATSARKINSNCHTALASISTLLTLQIHSQN